MSETLALRRSSKLRRSPEAAWEDTPYEFPRDLGNKPGIGLSIPDGFSVSVVTKCLFDPATPTPQAVSKFLASALRLLRTEGEAKGLSEAQSKLLTVQAFDPCYDVANAIWEQLRALVARPHHGLGASGELTCSWQLSPTPTMASPLPEPIAPTRPMTTEESEDMLEPLVYDWTEESYTVSEAIRNYLAEADAAP